MHVKQFSDFFSVNRRIFRFLGIWCSLKLFTKSSKITVAYILIVNTFLVFMPQICHIIYMYKARCNVVDFSNEFYVSLSSLMVLLKNWSVMKNLDRIQGLLVIVNSDMFKPTMKKERIIIMKVSHFEYSLALFVPIFININTIIGLSLSLLNKNSLLQENILKIHVNYFDTISLNAELLHQV